MTIDMEKFSKDRSPDYKKAMQKLERLHGDVTSKDALDFVGRCIWVTSYLNPNTISEDVSYHGYLTRDLKQLESICSDSDIKAATEAYNVYNEFAMNHYDYIQELLENE